MGSDLHVFRDFSKFLRNEKSQKFGSPEEAVRFYRKQVNKVIDHIGDLLPSDVVTGLEDKKSQQHYIHGIYFRSESE